MGRIFILILFAFCSIDALACTCWMPTDKKALKRMIREADAVLYVTAMADSLSESFHPGDTSRHITATIFKIEKAWKGASGQTVKLEAREAPCEGARYTTGDRYIIFVYLNKETGKLETNDCRSLCEMTIPSEGDAFRMKDEEISFEEYRGKWAEHFQDAKKLIDRLAR